MTAKKKTGKSECAWSLSHVPGSPVSVKPMREVPILPSHALTQLFQAPQRRPVGARWLLPNQAQKFGCSSLCPDGMKDEDQSRGNRHKHVLFSHCCCIHTQLSGAWKAEGHSNGCRPLTSHTQCVTQIEHVQSFVTRRRLIWKEMSKCHQQIVCEASCTERARSIFNCNVA